MLRFIRHYLLAVQFFTRIPVTGKLAAWVGYSPQMLRASAAHFPGIGLLVGTLTGGFFAVACIVLGKSYMAHNAPLLVLSIAVVLSCVFSVWLTGAFHEDGLADTADALGGYVSREKALTIMKDSRIGTYGTVALVLAFLLKVALLMALTAQSWTLTAIALVGAHAASRAMPLGIIATLPHVGDDAGTKSKPLAERISGGALIIGVLWWALSIAWCYWALPMVHWWLANLCAILAALYMRRVLSKRLHGFTGDGLGATQQLSELAFYLGLVLWWG